jgi:hypothetical protein
VSGAKDDSVGLIATYHIHFGKTEVKARSSHCRNSSVPVLLDKTDFAIERKVVR